MLVKGDFRAALRDFIVKSQEKKVDNSSAAIDALANKLENLIDERIKSIDIQIVIPPGTIAVVGTGSATNPAPIIINVKGLDSIT